MGFELEESIVKNLVMHIPGSRLLELERKAKAFDEIEDYVKSHYLDELGDPILGRDNHGSVAEYSIAIGEFVALKIGSSVS